MARSRAPSLSAVLVQFHGGDGLAQQFAGALQSQRTAQPALADPLDHQALRDMAEDLDLESNLIDYRRRRETLQNWSLTPDIWHEIITSLPPVPGPVRPNLDDRKRQEASAFIWARVTEGEPLFAPRPIEAGRPDDVRRAWFLRRANTWFQLGRPDPLGHYAALRERLDQHAERIAKDIDGLH